VREPLRCPDVVQTVRQSEQEALDSEVARLVRPMSAPTAAIVEGIARKFYNLGREARP
jgi:hypothetical protein